MIFQSTSLSSISSTKSSDANSPNMSHLRGSVRGRKDSINVRSRPGLQLNKGPLPSITVPPPLSPPPPAGTSTPHPTLASNMKSNKST